MMLRPIAFNRGFTLVELMVSMSIGTIVMLAVFSTYIYLGRNLTRLSYRATLESQSRKILGTFSSDIRNAKSVKSISDTGTGTGRAIELILTLFNSDPSKGTVPTLEVAYKYSYDAMDGIWVLTRDPDGNGLPRAPVRLNSAIGSNSVQVPVGLTLSSGDQLFSFTTASGNTFTTSGTGPTYQTTSTLVPMSVKQVAISFTLQAGTAAVQGQQGTLNSYAVASGRIPLVNHQLPDGS